MPKIEVNKVAEILKRNELEPALLRQVVEEMNLLVQPDADEERPPAIKRQYAVIVSDPAGTLSADYVAWVVQLPENESVMTALERVHRAAYEFNTSKRGRLMPAKTVGEAMEHVNARYFKQAGLVVKTKTPVFALVTDNRIPMEAKLPGLED